MRIFKSVFQRDSTKNYGNNTFSLPDLRICEVARKLSRGCSKSNVDNIMLTDGQTYGRQAHCYIFRTFRSGDKNRNRRLIKVSH